MTTSEKRFTSFMFHFGVSLRIDVKWWKVRRVVWVWDVREVREVREVR
jgi:hypothetical protein